MVRIGTQISHLKTQAKTNIMYHMTSNVKAAFFISALHKQVDPSQQPMMSAQSTGPLPGDHRGVMDGNDPLAKSLVKINTELSKVIQNLGSQHSASSTPVPGSNNPGIF